MSEFPYDREADAPEYLQEMADAYFDVPSEGFIIASDCDGEDVILGIKPLRDLKANLDGVGSPTVTDLRLSYELQDILDRRHVQRHNQVHQD